MKQFHLGQGFFAILACWLGLVLCLILPLESTAVEEGTPCIPEPTDMSIAYGDLVTCSIGVSGDADVFRFSGSTGEIILLQATYHSGSMRPCLKLVAPDGTDLEACENSFTNRIDTTLDQTGIYTILISDVFGTGTGEYAVALESIIPHSFTAQLIEYAETLQDEINPKGDVDLFYFEGTTSDTIVVEGTWQSGSMRPCIEMVAPDNTRLKACENSFTNRIDTTLDYTGTYRILVTDVFGTGTGEYALDLQCLAGPCVPFTAPDIAGCIKLKGAPLAGKKVILKQRGEDNQYTSTDAKGCYEFESAASGKKFKVIIKGPQVP
jgi:hypothetical protein